MAGARLPENAAGPWFVDASCIDCDVSRQLAPSMFVEKAGSSVVARQPETNEERRQAWKALVACPVAAIHGDGHAPPDLYPDAIEDNVYYCGYNSKRSYGANSFFARRPEGNFLVDSPRWAKLLVERLESMGGVRDILLTHQDDVADADRYMKHFGARVFIHEWDRRAAPYATHTLSGTAPTAIRPDLLAIPVPGHTRGSVAFLLEEKYLFTGDSLSWSRSREDLSAFRDYCWYSWEEQIESLRRLAAHRFEWVLAGHGDRKKLPAPLMKERLLGLVERMPRAAFSE